MNQTSETPLTAQERKRFASWYLTRYRPHLMRTTHPVREVKLRDPIPGKVRLPLSIAIPLMNVLRKRNSR